MSCFKPFMLFFLAIVSYTTARPVSPTDIDEVIDLDRTLSEILPVIPSVPIPPIVRECFILLLSHEECDMLKPGYHSIRAADAKDIENYISSISRRANELKSETERTTVPGAPGLPFPPGYIECLQNLLTCGKCKIGSFSCANRAAANIAAANRATANIADAIAAANNAAANIAAANNEAANNAGLNNAAANNAAANNAGLNNAAANNAGLNSVAANNAAASNAAFKKAAGKKATGKKATGKKAAGKKAAGKKAAGKKAALKKAAGKLLETMGMINRHVLPRSQ